MRFERDKGLEEILAAYDANAALDDARTIPGSWYTDARVAELELRTVFSRTWQLVGRADQVREGGQFLTAEIGREPVVVVRGRDGVLRAFFNVCRHHAAAVVTACEGRAERLRCPYHGWTYGLDGGLVSTTELDGVRGFDRAANGLVPMSVATWEGLVFVHLDPDPPSIADYVGARWVEQIAGLRLGDLRFATRREWTLECNWKVFVDNYLDGGYHVPFLHPSLNRILSFREYTIECEGRGCLQSSPIDPIDAAPHDGGDAVTASVRRGKARYFWLYPNLMLNWYEGYLDTNLVVPLGVDRVKVVFDFYFAPGADLAVDRQTDLAVERQTGLAVDRQTEANQRSIEVSARIQDEDHAICESVQRGLRSRAYGAGRLSMRREAGEHAFHKLLAADLRAGDDAPSPRRLV
jgi:choline monooxygenase